MTSINDFKFRLGKRDDLFKIGDVFSDSVRELCKEDYEPDIIDRWITSISPEFRIEYIDNEALWVAEVGGEIAGYLISIPGEIIALFVSPSYAGLGLGAALAKLGIEIAKDGASEVKLEATLTAVNFYKKLGFRDVGRGYYTNSQTDLRLPIVNMVLP